MPKYGKNGLLGFMLPLKIDLQRFRCAEKDGVAQRGFPDAGGGIPERFSVKIYLVFSTLDEAKELELVMHSAHTVH